MAYRIESLSRAHNRKEFDCGNRALNYYLCHTAHQHSEKGISRTFVLIADEKPDLILGFFTLAACEILVEKLPQQYAKRYPLQAPAAKLARLAVALPYQRSGLGTHMMLNAMDRILKVADHLGIIGFFVDAKDEQAVTFYRQFGFMTLPDNSLELFLPLSTIRKAFAGS